VTPSDRPKLLGDLLSARRKELGYTLKATVQRCEKPVSAAYLQKLEKGRVESPSPFILHELSHALGIPYPTLMEVAGYVFPSGHEQPEAGMLVKSLLQAEDLTPAERASLDAFLAEVAAAARRHFGG
jgi:HTH-type transcriptional regulator, competence development regulator